MPDTKFTGNKNVDVWWITEGGYASTDTLTAAEINAGVRLTEAIAWEGTTFPTASDSEEQSDLGLWDAANATSRGTANMDASLNLFFPKPLTDNITDYGKVYQLFRKLGLKGILVTRISQLTTTGTIKVATAGDWISIYKSITDGFNLDLEGDDSYKYNVNFLPQGVVKVNTQVKNAGPITLTRRSSAGSVTVGSKVVLKATLGGHDATQVVEWSTATPTLVSVSQNGVAIAKAAGSATVTATHPAATGATTAHAITIT